MTTYVLVHGAWGGPHGFRKVRRGLQHLGHEVYTPSLTGLGERVHLASPQVDLTTHVLDVVNAVQYEDLDDIVLMGFSYGGMVVNAALPHLAARVRHLVYLDAFVPDDGESIATLTNPAEPYRPLADLGSAWLVPGPVRHLDDPAEEAWADARRTAHPVGCFLQPVRVDRPIEDYPFTRTYVKATGEDRPDRFSAFWRAGDRAQASPHWRYREIATNHMVPENRPDEVVAVLTELD